MAISKAEDWLTEENLALLEGWARDGLSDIQIAQNIGISDRTLYRWKKEYGQICQSLKKGKEVADYQVENALFKRALGYTIEIKEQKIDKYGCVHDLVKDVHIPPDTGAIAFWLKNRKPDKWREKQDKPQANNDEEGVIIIDDLPKQ